MLRLLALRAAGLGSTRAPRVGLISAQLRSIGASAYRHPRVPLNSFLHSFEARSQMGSWTACSKANDWVSGVSKQGALSTCHWIQTYVGWQEHLLRSPIISPHSRHSPISPPISNLGCGWFHKLGSLYKSPTIWGLQQSP